jgi:YbbR domain-containing protein
MSPTMSEGWRNWGLRLLAVGIAIGIWFNASVEDRLVSSERVVEASVSYNRPHDFIVINPISIVNVRLGGSKKAVRQLNPSMVYVQVELTQRQEGSATITLGPDNVTAPDGVEVVSIEPATIRVDLEREVTERVPVFAKLTGEPAAGSTMQEPEVFPNQVLITGPASMVARLESLATRPISLDSHALTFEETVQVVTPDPLIQIVQPSKVTVRVPMQPTVLSPVTPKRKGKQP